MENLLAVLDLRTEFQIFPWHSFHKELNISQPYFPSPNRLILLLGYVSVIIEPFSRISRADDAYVNRLIGNVSLQVHFLGGQFIISVNIDRWSAGVNIFYSLHQRSCDDSKPSGTLNGPKPYNQHHNPHKLHPFKTTASPFTWFILMFLSFVYISRYRLILKLIFIVTYCQRISYVECVPCPCSVSYKITFTNKGTKIHTIFIRKNLLHVSTLLGQLQGEQSVTLLDASIQLCENVPLLSSSVVRYLVLLG
jgi:hypothetical protein